MEDGLRREKDAEYIWREVEWKNRSGDKKDRHFARNRQYRSERN